MRTDVRSAIHEDALLIETEAAVRPATARGWVGRR
jgi:hypothetical protein